MRLVLLGVRGSTPAPGPEFVRYGGHTSCVAVIPTGADRPTLLLDAGTGLRTLPSLLGGEPFRGALLVSHLHWDHVQGLPFCPAVDHPESRVDLYVPAQGGRTGRDLLAGNMSPPAFPITPEGLHGRWAFRTLEAGPCELGGLSVVAAEVQHKGGRTFGYRVSDGVSTVAYVPDHLVSAGVAATVHDLLEGADLVLHDAQFVDGERAWADAYGHCTVDDAVALADKAAARSLVLFHHAPGRTDDALDALAASLEAPFPVSLAVQGSTLSVPD